MYASQRCSRMLCACCAGERADRRRRARRLDEHADECTREQGSVGGAHLREPVILEPSGGKAVYAKGEVHETEAQERA